jgi:hypothetical protein
MQSTETGAPLYRIVVPTRDSARWVGLLYRQYRAMGVQPLYLVDSRSTDGTAELLRGLGAELHMVSPTENRVEGMLETTRALVEAEWVIRFDDDEMPSTALLEWLRRELPRVAASSIAFSRRDAALVDGALQFSRMEHYYWLPEQLTYLNPQWRGFRPAKVQFSNAIHSPGFDIADHTLAPPSAFFIHFDWILRSVAQRMEKLRGYERQRQGAGWTFAQFYLPEYHHVEANRWTRLETAEFDALAEALRPAGA